jgi:broad specificity phosphatase PhoE
MSNIYLIRHGFTPANNASYNGQKRLYTITTDPNMPLEMEYGRKQALEIGEFLSNLEGKTLILVSPYRRTRETLELALPKLKDSCDVEVCDELREINSGVHYGKTKEEMLEMYPESSLVYEGLKNDFFGTKYLHGESQLDVKERVKTIANRIKEISDSNKYSNILIFGHGTANRWICYWITGNYIDHPLKNGEVIMIKDNLYETVFVPNALVPLGYMVDIDKHKELINN